jgi:hypothetical protein
MNALSAIRIAAVALIAAALPSQVLISEINFTPKDENDDQWLEIVNLGNDKVDLTTWSVYQTTKTAGMPNNYWFAFPPGTEIAGKAFLRLHWKAPVKPSTATDIWTGDTVFHFLFGYGAESISKVSGAFALLSTQENVQMNSPGVYQDWITWGDSGFKRENVAIAAGRWLANSFIASPVAEDSLALDVAKQAEPTPPSAYFRDSSPTPGADNTAGADVAAYGNSCSNGSLPAPSLGVLSVPAIGNRDFGLLVRNTTANEQGILLLSLSQGTGIPILGCPLWVGVPEPIVTAPIAIQQGDTRVPLPLLQDVLTPGTVYLQVVAAAGAELAFSQGLMVSLGG